MAGPQAESEAAPLQAPLPSATTDTTTGAVEKTEDAATTEQTTVPATTGATEPAKETPVDKPADTTAIARKPVPATTTTKSPVEQTPETAKENNTTPAPETKDDAPPEPQACPLVTATPEQKKENGIDEVNPADFQGSVDSNNELPTVATLKRIENYTVLDRHGKSHTFKSLYTGPNVARRVLVIFVRHFFCGNCQEYLKLVSACITPDSLLRLPISTFIAVVGCGNAGLIDMYAEATGCPFPIYADPTRKLYDDLGMVKTLALGDRPAYMMNRSLITSSFTSIFQGIKQIKSGLALKGGDQRQIGGEFLFEPFSATTPTDELDRRMVARGKASIRSATMESVRTLDGADASKEDKSGEKLGVEKKNEEDEAEETDKSLDGRDHDDAGGSIEEKRVTWCHRMRTTRDHVEIPELAEILGVDFDANALAAAQGLQVEEQGPQPGRTSTSSNAAAPAKEKTKDKQQRWSRVLTERKGTGSQGTMAAQMGVMKREQTSD